MLLQLPFKLENQRKKLINSVAFVKYSKVCANNYPFAEFIAP